MVSYLVDVFGSPNTKYTLTSTHGWFSTGNEDKSCAALSCKNLIPLTINILNQTMKNVWYRDELNG